MRQPRRYLTSNLTYPNGIDKLLAQICTMEADFSDQVRLVFVSSIPAVPPQSVCIGHSIKNEALEAGVVPMLSSGRTRSITIPTVSAYRTGQCGVLAFTKFGQRGTEGRMSQLTRQQEHLPFFNSVFFEHFVIDHSQ